MVDLLILPISGPQGASSRYRIFQFLPELTKAGISHFVHLPPPQRGKGLGRLSRAHAEWRSITAQMHEAQAVFLQKRLLSVGRVEAMAKAVPYLFDFDDAIFTSPRGNRSLWSRWRTSARLHAVLKHAQTVIAGNHYLADYARQYAPNVVYLPTVLDHRLYPAKEHRATAPLVVGWIGHSVNHPYLDMVGKILQRLARLFSIRLLVVSDRDFSLSGVAVENRRWSADREIADILSMDIGIMPMPDDPWTRGKCGFKAIQYMAAGLPVVCSRVGANPEIVRHAVDGFCVSSPKEWLEALHILCQNVELRQQMGAQGRQQVAARFSLETATPRFLAVLAAVLVKPSAYTSASAS